MVNLEEVKTVSFMGRELMAAKSEDGKIYAGVSYICNGMGMSKNEKDRQIKNVQSDEVLIRGCVKFDAGVFDQNNATVALELDYVPLWLAKISITPTMKSENPQLAERLVQYQLKAKDALAAAFMKKRPATVAEQLLENAKIMVEHERRISLVEKKYDCIGNSIYELSKHTPSGDTWQADTLHQIRQLCAENNLNYQQFITDLYKELEESAGVNLETRRKNKRNRLELQGAKYAEIQKVSKLSIVSEDKKLREILSNLVRNHAAALVVAKMPTA